MKNKKFYHLILVSALFFFSGKISVQAESAAEPAIITVKPALQTAIVTGDKEKFEEDNWTARNTTGGIDSLTVSKQLNKQDSLEFEGRAIPGNNDYDTGLTLSREGVGSLIVAFKEFRKYYDGTGGFYPGFPSSMYNPVELNHGLHMDIGNFKIAAILAKENAPEYSLSYERDFRNGTKSLLDWGSVTNGVTTRKIYPSFLERKETVDRFKAGVKYEKSDLLLAGDQMVEMTKAQKQNTYSQTYNLITNTFTGTTRTQFQNMDSNLASTKLRFTKDFNDKFSFNCGVLYNHFKGGTMETLIGSTNREDPASIDQNSVTLLPNIYFIPFNNTTVSFGSRAEFIKKNGIADANTSAPETIMVETHSYQKIFTQDLGLKYNGIKNAVLYTDADFENKLITLSDAQEASIATDSFNREMDTHTAKREFTAGIKIYPLPKVNITLQEKAKNEFIKNNYIFTGGSANNNFIINSLNTISQDPSLKLNYKPMRWLALSLGYTFDSTTYGMQTRFSDRILKSKYQADIYSGEVTLTPFDYFYCSLFYEKKNARTKTPANGELGATTGNLPAYDSGVDVLGANLGYALTKKTTLDGGCSLYKSDNFVDYSGTGLPLGLNNSSKDIFIGCKHAFDKNRSLELKYTYKIYIDASSNHADDYEAHLLSAAMNMAF